MVGQEEGTLVNMKTWFCGMSFGRMLVSTQDSMTLSRAKLNAGAASRLLTEMTTGEGIRTTITS